MLAGMSKRSFLSKGLVSGPFLRGLKHFVTLPVDSNILPFLGGIILDIEDVVEYIVWAHFGYHEAGLGFVVAKQKTYTGHLSFSRVRIRSCSVMGPTTGMTNVHGTSSHVCK